MTDTPATASAGPAPEAAPGVDGALIARALRKVLDHAALTRTERAALRRYEKRKEERLRWQYYRSIPQKHWRRMSGRQAKVINEQAGRYGLPFAGAQIDLPAVVRALHDFLADHAVQLAREDDALMRGVPSPALEDYRRERATLARLDRLERQRRLLPRDGVRQALARIATMLRDAGQTLERRFGRDAVGILYDALDDARREIERSLGDDPVLEDEDAPAD